MARAEASWGGWQGASEAYIPRGSVTSEQRSQTPQIASARRVALLFGLSGVAPQSQTHKGYAPSSRLAQAKNQQQRGPSQYFNSLLGLERVIFPKVLLDPVLRCVSTQVKPLRSQPNPLCESSEDHQRLGKSFGKDRARKACAIQSQDRDRSLDGDPFSRGSQKQTIRFLALRICGRVLEAGKPREAEATSVALRETFASGFSETSPAGVEASTGIAQGFARHGSCRKQRLRKQGNSATIIAHFTWHRGKL